MRVRWDGDIPATLLVVMLSVVLTGFAALVIFSIGQHANEKEALLRSYTECLRTMHEHDVADIQMFCDKIKDRL